MDSVLIRHFFNIASFVSRAMPSYTSLTQPTWLRALTPIIYIHKVGCSEAPTHPTLALTPIIHIHKVGCSEAPTHPTLAFHGRKLVAKTLGYPER